MQCVAALHNPKPLLKSSSLALEKRKALYFLFERAHRFYAVGRNNRSSGVVKPASEARAVSAVGSSDGVGRAVCALTGAWRGREAAEPPTHSIADGTAEIASGESR